MSGMEVKVLVQNCAENQKQKSELLALFWSLYHRLFFLLTFSFSYFLPVHSTNIYEAFIGSWAM